jgi:hypothetical protein
LKVIFFLKNVGFRAELMFATLALVIIQDVIVKKAP